MLCSIEILHVSLAFSNVLAILFGYVCLFYGDLFQIHDCIRIKYVFFRCNFVIVKRDLTLRKQQKKRVIKHTKP